MGEPPCTRDPDLFFSDVVSEMSRARAICLGCAQRQSCYEGAVARQEPFGIWGGVLFRGTPRTALRGRGRPLGIPGKPMSMEEREKLRLKARETWRRRRAERESASSSR